jgi:hypothetical protein
VLCSRLNIIIIAHETFKLELLCIRSLAVRSAGHHCVSIGSRPLFILLGQWWRLHVCGVEVCEHESDWKMLVRRIVQKTSDELTEEQQETDTVQQQNVRNVCDMVVAHFLHLLFGRSHEQKARSY